MLTDDKILKMARESGLGIVYAPSYIMRIARAAYAAGAAAEMEACATLAECFVNGGMEIGDAIRSRTVDGTAAPKFNPCRWWPDDENGEPWATECGGMFVIIDSTPADNDMRCYCGGKLVQITKKPNATS